MCHSNFHYTIHLSWHHDVTTDVSASLLNCYMYWWCSCQQANPKSICSRNYLLWAYYIYSLMNAIASYSEYSLESITGKVHVSRNHWHKYYCPLHWVPIVSCSWKLKALVTILSRKLVAPNTIAKANMIKAQLLLYQIHAGCLPLVTHSHTIIVSFPMWALTRFSCWSLENLELALRTRFDWPAILNHYHQCKWHGAPEKMSELFFAQKHLPPCWCSLSSGKRRDKNSQEL